MDMGTPSPVTGTLQLLARWVVGCPQIEQDSEGSPLENV
jgi:hypothetical protein